MSKITFKPKARLILQLGDQLIRNEQMALLELAKNAYDADATKITITMKEIESKEHGRIIIEDNGIGMDYETVRNVWFEIGSNYKERLFKSKIKSPKYGRLPLGEKGIGRFGLHKLGDMVEIITKAEIPRNISISDFEDKVLSNLNETEKKIVREEYTLEENNYLINNNIGKDVYLKLKSLFEKIEFQEDEVYFKIDWTDFSKEGINLEDISFAPKKRTPEHFKQKKFGTRIIITHLRQKWNKVSVRELYRSVLSLNSPFSSIDEVKIFFKLDNQAWLSGLPKFEEIEKHSLFNADITIKGSQITNFIYNFTPWNSMKKLEKRDASDKDIPMVEKNPDPDSRKNKKYKSINLGDHKIGTVKIKLLIFDQTPKILSLGTIEKTSLKEYLKKNGGIRVYRDGIRVYDYGEPGNDWLNLDIRRVNVPSVRFSNNIIIGAVYINREESQHLVEKTNREGFVEDEAYIALKKAIIFALEKVEVQRNIDKDLLYKFYGATSSSAPVTEPLQKLKDTVEKRITNKEIKNEISKHIKTIEKDYKYITNIYIKSSMAGLNLSIVIHEIEKIMNEIDHIIEGGNIDKRLVDYFTRLSKMLDRYSTVLRTSGVKKTDMKEVITQALFNAEFRFKVHNINIINYLEKFEKKSIIKCEKGLILGALSNIFDNAIWWLWYYKEQKKQIQTKSIYIGISNELPGYISIVIADSGLGFTVSTEQVIKPFFTDKPDGIGLGLHIVSEIMNASSGKLLLPEYGDFFVPEEFKKGAIIVLAFKEENK